MSINEYQKVTIRPKNEVEAEQKQIRSRPEADQKQTGSRPEADQKVTQNKWKQIRSKMTGIGIFCQPKFPF